MRKVNIFELIETGSVEAAIEALRESSELVNSLGEGNPNYRDRSPLMYALQTDQFSLVQPLIDRGADVNFKMPAGRKIPLINFSIEEFTPIAILRLLLEQNADPNVYDYEGETPLRKAIYGVSASHDDGLEKVDLLLEYGADPDLKPVSEEPEFQPGTCREYVFYLKEEFPNDITDELLERFAK